MQKYKNKRKWKEEPPDNQLQQLKKPKKQPYYLSFLAEGSRFEFKMDSGAPATTGKIVQNSYSWIRD